MKLGIAVVYLVQPEDEAWFDLHLRHIERFTDVPYTIYAGVNRLLPQFRRKLEQHPLVKICNCPPTELRGGREHAHYLEHLTRFAIEDGVSHVATLHVDSFPIRVGWAQALADRLTVKCAFDCLEGINTACILFSRDFYLNFHPTYHVSAEEYASPLFKEYVEAAHPGRHSGIGYGFTAYRHGLSWYSLPAVAVDPHGVGSIYDDLIYHLGGLVRLSIPSQVADASLRSRFSFYLARLLKMAKSAVPRSIRQRLPLAVRAPYGDWYSAHILARAKREAIADFDAYLSDLRRRMAPLPAPSPAQ